MQAPWLQRWLQRDDDVLLYWDQTMIRDVDMTYEEYAQAMHDHAQETLAAERTRQIIEERRAWAAAQEEREA